MSAPNWKPEPALRSPEWLAYVRSLPSVESGKRPCVAHHLIGNGRLSNLKTSDFFAFPLTDAEHKVLHGKGWAEWERKYGNQYRHALATLEQGIRDGVLAWTPDAPSRLWAESAQELEQAIREGELVLDKRAAKYIANEDFA